MKKACLLFSVICIAILFYGCGNSKEETVSKTEFEENIKEQQNNTDSMSYVTESTEMEVKSEMEEVQQIGTYSLDDCVEYDGLYYAYDDGSFDKVATGGYCLGGKGYIDGMFLDDYYKSKIEGTDKMVLFWEGQYSMELYPVAAQIPVIQLEKEDGTRGFGHFDWSDTSVLVTYYRDHVHERVIIQTINGALPEEYEPECIEFTVNPYKGIPSEERYICLNGFKPNTEVTLGIAEGTTLEEKTYKVDATYYLCSRDSNHYEEEDSYKIKTTPTAQGYAELDFSEIPDGKYVMVLWYNGFSNYRATLLELHRS